MIKKDNALINAAYTLTLAEQRLILLAVAEASGDMEKLKHVTIHAADYAQRFNITKWSAYEALNSASDQLFNRYFRYQEKTKNGSFSHIKTRWVQSIGYIKDEGVIKVKFADDVLPFLCELKNRFTIYSIEAIAGLKSTYSIRLYEVLIAWKNSGKTPVISLDNLRLRLGLEAHEYERMTDFKRRVLDAAIKQINENSDINASYEQQKSGRKITGFIFHLDAKEKPSHVANNIDFISGKPDKDKTKRQKIKKSDAEKMARPGETYEDLYKRLSSKYIIA